VNRGITQKEKIKGEGQDRQVISKQEKKMAYPNKLRKQCIEPMTLKVQATFKHSLQFSF